MRTLGIDYGEKRVGVAISDPLGSIALGLCTLHIKGLKDAIAKVCEVCREKGVETIVVGLPLNMNGSAGPMAEKVEAFAARLGERTGLPIVMSDERLSSAMAERTLLEADMSRGKRKGVIDKMAAQVILQGHLDREGFEADLDIAYE
ncbi:MAG: Holliday junction resolvase RuvX [Verrucomicrobia bacterium]|nr:Holliday junction resolvase RuvX [Verrucomicrobiota bacterium]